MYTTKCFDFHKKYDRDTMRHSKGRDGSGRAPDPAMHILQRSYAGFLHLSGKRKALAFALLLLVWAFFFLVRSVQPWTSLLDAGRLLR